MAGQGAAPLEARLRAPPRALAAADRKHRCIAVHAPAARSGCSRRRTLASAFGNWYKRALYEFVQRSWRARRRPLGSVTSHRRWRGARKEWRMAVAVDGGDPSAATVPLGGTVQTVLDSPRIAPAPATLEEARNAPGRREKIEQITRRIEEQGIKYVFFQQVSVTGRVMGKGVVSTFFPQVAREGLPARVRRHRQPVHRPPRQLHRVRARGVRARGGGRPRHVRRAAVGRAGRARVLRLLRHRDR